jgi:hypothetical protein
VLVCPDAQALGDDEARILEANGWSLTTHELVSPRDGSLASVVDSVAPQLVHIRGEAPLSGLLRVRARGLPVLLEHQAREPKIFPRRLATLVVSTRSIARPGAPTIHHLYLATLNIAFSPPPVRAQTRGELSGAVA